MPDKKQFRKSTAEFLIFSAQSGEDGLEVRYEDETIWLTQKLKPVGGGVRSAGQPERLREQSPGSARDERSPGNTVEGGWRPEGVREAAE